MRIILDTKKESREKANGDRKCLRDSIEEDIAFYARLK